MGQWLHCMAVKYFWSQTCYVRPDFLLWRLMHAATFQMHSWWAKAL